MSVTVPKPVDAPPSQISFQRATELRQLGPMGLYSVLAGVSATRLGGIRMRADAVGGGVGIAARNVQ